MKFAKTVTWTLLALALSCSDKNKTTPLVDTYPTIQSFATAPSDQFIIDETAMKLVARAHPYKGSNLSCSHQGAHLHFKDSVNDYSVNIYAPADGTVSRITPCYDLGNNNDKYDLALAIAKDGNETVLFCFSLEPFSGLLCQSNPNFYLQYVFVTKGQKVKKGDVIAKLYKKANTDDATHIHFHLQKDKTGTFHCPSIFNKKISSAFEAVYKSENCSGVSFGSAGFCYLPGDGENLTGL